MKVDIVRKRRREHYGHVSQKQGIRTGSDSSNARVEDSNGWERLYAQGGPRVVQVYGWGKDYLDIERVGSASPTPQAARAFGAALARMHDAGAKYFGSAPDGYNGTCYFGPLQDPVKMDTGEWTDPISYFADERVRPMVNLGVKRGELDKRDVELTERVIEALPDLMGRAAADKPARIHGDLWSGN